MLNTTQPHPEWRALVEFLKEKPYGSEFTHEVVASVCGLVAGSRRYFSQVQRAGRDLLRDWQRDLESVPSQGYRLVQPSEFHSRGRRLVRLAGRRLRRAAATHVAAPQHLLTDAENVANANALAKIGALEAHRRRVLHETRPNVLQARPDTPKLLSA